MSHIPVEIMGMATGIKCRHVPYSGGGPCLSAVVGGHVNFATQFDKVVINDDLDTAMKEVILFVSDFLNI